MSKYENLDALILERISDGPKTFHELLLGRNGLEKDCQKYESGAGDAFRVLDRRLQALRKKGLITFMKGWRKVPGQ